MTKPRLVISAAHTSMSPGSVYKDLREFDLTRKILEKCVKHLKEQNVEHSAVPVDLQLLDRIDWINKTGYTEEKGDLFIEVHVNDGGKRGIEGWYAGKDETENNAKKFAEILQDDLIERTKFENQGVHSEFDHELGSLLILNQTNPISAAFELLYIDNEEDYKLLKDETKLDELAKNFVLAIKKYIDNPPKLFEVKKKKANNPFGSLGSSFPNFSNPFAKGGSDPFGLGEDDTDDSSDDSDSMMMDRDQRKTMITETYKKLLGKEPNQMDMNQYLNTGISKDKLIKKIIDSPDYEKLVKDAEEAEDLRNKTGKMEADLKQLHARVKDMHAMHEHLKKLLQHKDIQIKQMQDALVKKGVIRNGEYFDPNRII
ncbi:N-acetylmuramoyl-L-alanine amidase [Candidatus Dojkabacteria bacterium]|uniref:N-acetylmuramoyl-L-alanine amidase n=1 Tax=Candidatus Dojkabacteria bacterium TaxID=2099670 RepID=A0A955RLA8_9BACT|nr:N-acetylmuramoyl-L-alanine amidase [Candidatus Dojkabacteria bacterium]